MKNIYCIIYIISILLLNSCQTPLDNYPNFIKQKDKIKSIVALMDFSFRYVETDNVTPFNSTDNEYIVSEIKRLLMTVLNNRGYRMKDIIIYAPLDTSWIDHIYKKTNNTGIENEKLPPNINKEYIYLGERAEPEYHEVFPAKIETNLKYIDIGDTLIKDNLDVAILFKIRGVSISTGKKILDGFVATLGGALSFGVLAVAYIEMLDYWQDYIEIQFYIIDRTTNDVIWSNSYSNTGMNPIGIQDIFEMNRLISMVFYDLPVRKLNNK